MVDNNALLLDLLLRLGKDLTDEEFVRFVCDTMGALQSVKGGSNG